jgi:hypothetical protein
MTQIFFQSLDQNKDEPIFQMLSRWARFYLSLPESQDGLLKAN